MVATCHHHNSGANMMRCMTYTLQEKWLCNAQLLDMQVVNIQEALQIRTCLPSTLCVGQ